MPTIGRETLGRARATALDDERHTSVPLIVGDGYNGLHVWDSLPIRHNDYGAAARNFALGWLAGDPEPTHVAHLDDDDGYLPGTVHLFRQWATDDPDALHIGRIIGDDGHTVIAWTKREIRKGQVATPTMLAPKWAAVQVRWESVYDHDWRWARDVAKLVPRVEWHDEVVAVVKPWGRT